MTTESLPRPYQGTAAFTVALDGAVHSAEIVMHGVREVEHRFHVVPPHSAEPHNEPRVVDTEPALPAYPPQQPEHVAPEATHNAYLKRQRAEAHHKLRYRVGAAALGSLILLGGAGRVLQIDQNNLAPIFFGEGSTAANQVAANNYHPSTDKKNMPPATDVLVVGGMGVNDAAPRIARPLVPSLNEAIDNSKLYAVKYGARVSLPNMYKAVDDMLTESPADELILYGMSTGCKAVVYIAAYVREHWPDVFLKIVFCDSGPYDAQSTYELRKDPSKITLGQTSAERYLFFGPLVASAVDLNSQGTRQKYLTPTGQLRPEKFKDEMGRIARDIWNNDAASNELRVGQLALIVDDSVAGNMEKIGATPEGMPPVTFVYIAPTRDTTVDGNYAANAFREDAINNHIPYKNIPVESEHAGDNDYADAYNIVIADAVRQVDKETRLWRQKNAPPLSPSVASLRPSSKAR